MPAGSLTSKTIHILKYPVQKGYSTTDTGSRLAMAPLRKRQKTSTASLSTATSLSRNVSAASTHSTPPHTPPSQSRPSPPQTSAALGIFTPNHVKHLIANLDVECIFPFTCWEKVRDRATRLRNHYNLLASTLRIRGEARMSRIPSHLRSIKIKELRELQKHGISREKQVVTEVLGTRLLASVSRPNLKRCICLILSLFRKPSDDEVSDSDGHAGIWFLNTFSWQINGYFPSRRIRVGRRAR
jgi:hypothetical protein